VVTVPTDTCANESVTKIIIQKEVCYAEPTIMYIQQLFSDQYLTYASEVNSYTGDFYSVT